MKLTAKQESFCLKFVECNNASEAYRHAYSCAKWKDTVVWSKASVLLTNGKVLVRVEELRAELKNKSDITKQRLLEELGYIAFSSIAQLHNTWIELKEFEQLTDEQKRSIKSISTKTIKKSVEGAAPIDVEYVKIELHDKMRAIENISKMLGFYEPEKRVITFPNIDDGLID